MTRRAQLTQVQMNELHLGQAAVYPGWITPGLSFHEVACQRTWDREWLEGLVEAGFLPTLEGLLMALQGVFLLNRAHLAQHSPEGCPDGDAPCLDFTAFYRVMAERLLREAEYLDQLVHHS